MQTKNIQVIYAINQSPHHFMISTLFNLMDTLQLANCTDYG